MNQALLPIPMPGKFLLLVAPDSAAHTIFDLVAYLALKSPLFVLDGGNTFQGYELARILRRHTVDFQPAMSRVILSRVFTCYQMQALLEGSALDTAQMPLVALDFLATFYDQGVRVSDRRRLLRECIGRLQALAHRSPVVVWVRRRSLVPPEGLEFLDRLVASAGEVWSPPEPGGPAWSQPQLLS